MKPLLEKILIILAFAVNIGLTVFGFAALLDSSYTGIRMSVCGDHACVKSVDRGSPADGKIVPGDRLLDVACQNISYLAFNIDPDYIQSELDHEIFWNAARKLEKIVVKNKPVELLIERNGRPATIYITSVQFPFSHAFMRTLPVYIVGWTFFLVAYLILRKKASETSIAFFILGIAVCINFTAANPYAIRDVSFHYLTFRFLSHADFLAEAAIPSSLLSFVLTFPKRKKILNDHPWIMQSFPFLFLFIVILRYGKFIDNTHMTTFIPLTATIFLAVSVFVVSYFSEKDPITKKQIKWVIFGMLVTLISYGGLTSVPVMFGMPIVSAEISVLPTILIPLGFAFAITKYRLMEIDNILDTAVIYGFTILVLAGVETTFLSFASPYLLTAGKGLPAFSVVAVLLIVFIYVPIRNVVKNMVERLFKRGKYDPEKELQQFTVNLGLCDERSALEKFSAFVKDLLRPSGIAVLKIGDGTATILHASNDLARREGEKIVSRVEEVWGLVRSKGTCTFGYELSEKIGQDGVPFTSDMENALFVPFITDQDNTTSGYLAALLKKWNETAYSVKDVTLLNAISVNIANIIEAGELRKERAEIEERHRKEKDTVMKELHDGLGNILTSITVTSQAAERMLEKDESKAKELVERIGEFTAESMDFLRTGLTVLDNPHGEIGSIMEGVKDRYAEMFASSGIELGIECSEETGRLRPGAMVALNITRVIQEALNNIMKHSEARRVRMRLFREGSRLSVAITDDGKGFVAGVNRSGFGLTSMKQRVEEMKGSLRIDSSPGKGTEIGFTVFAG